MIMKIFQIYDEHCENWKTIFLLEIVQFSSRIVLKIWQPVSLVLSFTNRRLLEEGKACFSSSYFYLFYSLAAERFCEEGNGSGFRSCSF